MSVVVRMEMPENCAVCPFVTEYSRCVFLGMYAIDEDRRADNCPIICQLPEGHGRLVDADAAVNDIRNEIRESKMEGIPTDHLWLTKCWIADEDICPTIVPAERSET